MDTFFVPTGNAGIGGDSHMSFTEQVPEEYSWEIYADNARFGNFGAHRYNNGLICTDIQNFAPTCTDLQIVAIDNQCVRCLV